MFKYRKVLTRHIKFILAFFIFTIFIFGGRIVIQQLPIIILDRALNNEREVSILINSRPTAIRDELAKAIKNRDYVKLSGSYPNVFYKLLVVDGGNEVEFKLGQDSKDENLYWVYFPKYKFGGSLCYIQIANLETIAGTIK